jgi:hypothetical protein
LKEPFFLAVKHGQKVDLLEVSSTTTMRQIDTKPIKDYLRTICNENIVAQMWLAIGYTVRYNIDK